MFSGIVEEVGVVVASERPSRLRVRAQRVLEGLHPGDSVAVSGACLTAVTVDAETFEVDLSPETEDRTTLASLGPGAQVNLERALRLDARLGGHFVQGHIDGVGVVESMERQDEFAVLTLRLPPSILPFCVEKGSLAVDGISLTIAALDGVRVRISLIPHTLAATIAGGYAPGSRINLEADLLAKLVAVQLEPYRAAAERTHAGG